jgi:hypothetical protein
MRPLIRHRVSGSALDVNQMYPFTARSGTRSVLFVTQVARRAPEHDFAKFQVEGGARSGTRNIERVVVSKRHGEPPNPVLQRFRPTGAPKAARAACC